MSNDLQKKIDQALFNFYLEADDAAIGDSIKEDVPDIDEYTKKKRRIIFLAKATAKHKYNQDLLELSKKFQDAILLNLEKPIAMLKQFIQSNESLSLYRNLDKLTKEDIIEIIKDKNLIKLLEDLDEGKASH